MARQSPQEGRRNLTVAIDRENDGLRELQEEVRRKHVAHEEAMQYYRDQQQNLRLAKDLADQATRDYQLALEAVSERQGRINRMRGQQAVLVGQETGGVAGL